MTMGSGQWVPNIRNLPLGVMGMFMRNHIIRSSPMAIQPGSIKHIIDVPLRHPRDRSDQEFVGLERRIKDLVREEVIKLGVV